MARVEGDARPLRFGQRIKLVAQGALFLGGFWLVVELAQPALTQWATTAVPLGALALLALSLFLFHIGLRSVLAGAVTDNFASSTRWHLFKRRLTTIDYPMVAVAGLALVLLLAATLGM